MVKGCMGVVIKKDKSNNVFHNSVIFVPISVLMERGRASLDGSHLDGDLFLNGRAVARTCGAFVSSSDGFQYLFHKGSFDSGMLIGRNCRGVVILDQICKMIVVMAQKVLHYQK
jgi:hypothetical protein